MNPRTERTKEVLWVLAMFGLVALVLRVFLGLGATTNLTDAMPWGLWKVFNMVAGVALATGGFVMACIVYVFHLDRYRPLLRPAIVIAFLGYGSSVFSLLWDIGLPYRIWHPIIPSMWNPHSFLFEVAWCVMLYFSVSALELSPTVIEKSPWQKVAHFLHRISPPIVVIGITLSSLHHSSLGSLFLVSPGRLHPLWYSGNWIPFQFFVSAVGAGMMTVVLVALLYSRLFWKPPDLAILQGVSRAAAAVLVLFLGLRLGEITVHGKWPVVFSGQWESYVFGVEVLLQAVLPVMLLSFARVRRSPYGLGVTAALAMLGLSLHRIDTGITGYVRWLETPYFPSGIEIAFSLGVYAAAGLVFLFLAEHFDVFGDPAAPQGGADPSSLTDLGHGLLHHAPSRISLVAVLAVSLAVLAFSTPLLEGFPLVRQTVQPPTGADPVRSTLRINGNHNQTAVTFSHRSHQQSLGGAESCAKCHHVNKPNDPETPCWRCHTDMMIPRSIFDHSLHEKALGGKAVCSTCHDMSRPKGRDNAPACADCHLENMALSRLPNPKQFDDRAPGYKNALHRQCIGCHEKSAAEMGWPEMAECATCHP